MLEISLYAINVIAAIVWFGGGLAGVLVIGPALQRSSSRSQHEVSPLIAAVARRVYPPAGIVTTGAGALLALLARRFESLAALTAPYGLTLIAALVRRRRVLLGRVCN